MMKKVWLGLGFGLIGLSILAARPAADNPIPASEASRKWVDSVYRKLSDTERIGQLFMVAAYSNRDAAHLKQLTDLVENHHIGGLIFFQGGPGRQVNMINHLQQAAKVPLLIGIDGEWGLGMRLDSSISYPKQMTLGAIQDDRYIYYMGKEIARQAKLVGVHVNFAPVVDINSNSNNPVIGYRSFGEDKELVAQKGIAYMQGMQDAGVMANAKHFPGHGDTGSDSHLTLPVITHDKARIEETELYPFQRLMDVGLMSTMVAHIHMPAYDDTPNRATTLSPAVVNGLLKDQMDFQGLVFTDALNMQGVAKFYGPGEVDLQAILAGNDVLLFAEDVPKAVEKIREAIKKGDLKKSDIEQRVKKILAAKYWAGLNRFRPLSTDGLNDSLHTPEAKLIQQRLYEEAITVVRNRRQQIPIQVLDTTSFASITLGQGPNTFQRYLDKYADFTHYQLPKTPASAEDYSQMLHRLSQYEHVIVGLHDLSNRPSKDFGVKKEDYLFLETLKQATNVTLVYFGNPYGLKYFDNFPTIICTYEDNDLTQKIAPQVLFGALKAKGRLPVTVSERFPEGLGEDTYRLGRLFYSLPEDVGMDSQILGQIDGLAQLALNIKAAPGMQIVVARKGAIVYEKNFGYLTYENDQPVTDRTIYDLASITKAAATLQSVMFLEDRGIIDVKKKASTYATDLQGTNKENLILEDVLLHQAGLTPWIPHWKRTQDVFSLDDSLYSIYPTDFYTRQLTSELYISEALQDSVWKWTLDSNLRPSPRRGKKYDYRYSDLGFYILHNLVEEQARQPMDVFLEQNFYRPLGLGTMGYLPLCRFPADRIAPTEDDNYFRNELVLGRVHDQGAAMYGGIAGHAGLFSNAHDLAVLMQMNLQEGYYGGTRYFRPGLVTRFSERKAEDNDNRRGWGWDKPAIPGNPTPTGELVPVDVYGHTGFTGTAAWVDPKYELVYIFLSNRVHPSADNRKLISYNIRTRIQDVIYASLADYEPATEPEEPK